MGTDACAPGYGGDGESGVHNGETEPTEDERRRGCSSTRRVGRDAGRGRRRAARGRDGRKWPSDTKPLAPARPSSLDRAPRGHARGAASSPFRLRSLRCSVVNSVVFATSCSRPPQLLGSRSDLRPGTDASGIRVAPSRCPDPRQRQFPNPNSRSTYNPPMQLGRTVVLAVSSVLLAACTRVAPQPEPRFDVVIRGGMVYDGSGTSGRRADVGIKGDRIAADWRSVPSTRQDGRRCRWTCGRAGLHQHAVVVDGLADRGWPFAGRDSRGHHDADFRRGQLDGAR